MRGVGDTGAASTFLLIEEGTKSTLGDAAGTTDLHTVAPCTLRACLKTLHLFFAEVLRTRS